MSTQNKDTEMESRRPLLQKHSRGRLFSINRM
jgi:hypothetical protein